MLNRKDGTYDVVEVITGRVIASGLTWVSACDRVCDELDAPAQTVRRLGYVFHDPNCDDAYPVDTTDDVNGADTTDDASEDTRESFMRPEVTRGGYYEIETTDGTEIIPSDLVGTDPSMSDFSDYLSGSPLDDDDCPEERKGWLYRMQAPGYLDATEWSVADTEAHAYSELLEAYGSDDDGPREDWEDEAEEYAIATPAE